MGLHVLREMIEDVPRNIVDDELYRACFVAWLIANDIWVDTWEYDTLLADMARWRGQALTEDEENYLIEYIV